MAKTKYGKYIISELKKMTGEADWRPPFAEDEIKFLVDLDTDVIEGAPYAETGWILPGIAKRSEPDVEAHTHDDYDEVIGLFGTNMDDVWDLGGEMEIWLDDEKHIITKSCIIFVPKGLQHGPIRWLRCDRPVFHFTFSTAKKYV
jgi:hypothetical protein